MKQPPALAAALLVAVPHGLEAHVGAGGIIDSYSGLLHPYTEPMHIITLLGLGFMLTQQERNAPPMGWLTFCFAAIAGLIVSGMGITLPLSIFLLVLAMLLGGLVAVKPPLPIYFSMLLSAVTGFMLGLDSLTGFTGIGTTVVLIVSTATGLAIALLIVMGWGDYFRKDWQQIGIRVIGSWIAASALLVFTLTLKT
jgi:hypothetical protein